MKIASKFIWEKYLYVNYKNKKKSLILENLGISLKELYRANNKEPINIRRVA